MVITALFVLLTFLAGIHGMNFENVPELKFKYGYYSLLGAMSITSICIIVWFKKSDGYNLNQSGVLEYFNFPAQSQFV